MWTWLPLPGPHPDLPSPSPAFTWPLHVPIGHIWPFFFKLPFPGPDATCPSWSRKALRVWPAVSPASHLAPPAWPWAPLAFFSFPRPELGSEKLIQAVSYSPHPGEAYLVFRKTLQFSNMGPQVCESRRRADLRPWGESGYHGGPHFWALWTNTSRGPATVPRASPAPASSWRL